jgi:hypothetical protein
MGLSDRVESEERLLSIGVAWIVESKPGRAENGQGSAAPDSFRGSFARKQSAAAASAVQMTRRRCQRPSGSVVMHHDNGQCQSLA